MGLPPEAVSARQIRSGPDQASGHAASAATLPDRPPGIVRRITAEMREWCERLLKDPVYQENIRLRIMAGEARHLELFVWQTCLGKPRDTVKLEGAPRRPATIVFLDGPRRDPMASSAPPKPIDVTPKTVRPSVALPEVSFELDDLADPEGGVR